MEKYIDVMNQSLDLSGTILEGLTHIHRLIAEGQYEQSTVLFSDTLSGVASIEKAINPIVSKNDKIDVNENMNDVIRTMGLLVNRFENKDYNKIQEILQFTLVPQFKKLKEELEKAFQPYTVS